MMPLTYNPYEYMKTAGVTYEAFLDNIGFNMLASYYLENELLDSLHTLLNSAEYVLAKSLQIQFHMDSNNYSEAELLYTDISESPDADVNGFNSMLQSMGLNLSFDTLTWQQATPTQLGMIKLEAQRNDRVGIQAKLLLELLTEVAYIEPINILNDELTIEELKLIQQNYPTSELNSIQIYPHPVGSGSVVEINLGTIQKNTKFIITDVQGRYIMQFPLDNQVSYFKLDNTLLKPGVYIGYISNISGQRISKQIVVIQ